MKLAFYGSSLLSSYWNGAATYYRGVLRALAELGWEITFLEPDAFGRGSRRDLAPPDWARVVVWPATPGGLFRAAEAAQDADVVVKASGVGYEDEMLLSAVMAAAPARAVRAFWDVDAPATLAALEAKPSDPLRRMLPDLDLVLCYGGGERVSQAYRKLGAPICRPICNGLDAAAHHPVDPDPRFEADLAFLGNRLPDREARVERFFLSVAEAMPERRFLLGGAGWEDRALPANVRHIGHVGTADHNAFNCTPLAVLNISRESMAKTGHSPATRVFEAAGAGACLITDAWEGIESFFAPGREVLVARDGAEVAATLRDLTFERARAIGGAARERALADHAYSRRAEEADALLRTAVASRREAAA